MTVPAVHAFRASARAGWIFTRSAQPVGQIVPLLHREHHRVGWQRPAFERVPVLVGALPVGLRTIPSTAPHAGCPGQFTAAPQAAVGCSRPGTRRCLRERAGRRSNGEVGHGGDGNVPALRHRDDIPPQPCQTSPDRVGLVLQRYVAKGLLQTYSGNERAVWHQHDNTHEVGSTYTSHTNASHDQGTLRRTHGHGWSSSRDARFFAAPRTG